MNSFLERFTYRRTYHWHAIVLIKWLILHWRWVNCWHAGCCKISNCLLRGYANYNWSNMYVFVFLKYYKLRVTWRIDRSGKLINGHITNWSWWCCCIINSTIRCNDRLEDEKEINIKIEFFSFVDILEIFLKYNICIDIK